MIKRRGIVLMMTLTLITIMMGLITFILTLTNHFLKISSLPFLQNSSLIIINDLEYLLPDLLKDVKGGQELDLLMRLPIQIKTKKEDFTLDITFSSPYKHININNLLTKEGVFNPPTFSLLLGILVRYPIADTNLFLQLLYDTLDTDIIERQNGTEIHLTQPDFKNGSISNFSQFNQILERYIALTQDTAILSIPWHEYIGFEGERIDFNAVDAKTLELALLKVSPENSKKLTTYRTKAFTSKEEVIAQEPTLATTFDTFFFIYKPDMTYNVIGDVYIHQIGQKQHLKFYYNLLTKKITRVTFL